MSEYYPIVKGDTLSAIADKYGISLQDVMANNPWISNPNQITAGDYMYMPKAQLAHEVTAGNVTPLVSTPQPPVPQWSEPGMRHSIPVETTPFRLDASPQNRSLATTPLADLGLKYNIQDGTVQPLEVVAPTPPVILPVAPTPPVDTYDLGETVVTAPRYGNTHLQGLNLSGFGRQPDFGPTINIPEPAAVQPTPEMDLVAMYNKYAPPLEDYSKDLRLAQKDITLKQKAFDDSILQLMNQKVEGPSKAELYFRLASAFGEPTKTGHFIESLGKAGGVAAEYNKEHRVMKQAQRSEALKFGLEKQKLDLQSAKDRETTLRTLAAEDSKSRRELSKEIIKDYIASGKPQSAAGKQAMDEGFSPGTPEYQTRVAAIGNLLVERQMAAINASLAGITAQQGQLDLGKRREARAERSESKLTPQELDLKVDTEDAISTASGALDSLTQALKLNPNTFDTSLGDQAQRKALEAVGSTEARVVNTRNMENLLKQQALSQLKSLVGGNPTEGERAVIMDLQGVDAKSTKERQLIIERAIKTIESRKAKAEKRLKDINAGRYRQTSGEN